MYAELHVTTNYSFLRGASHPEELFAQAAAYGIAALGIVDHDSVAGIVRAWDAAKTTGVRLVPGCRLGLRDGTALLTYPTDRAAWSRLCRLLTLGVGRTGKGGCDLGWEDLRGADDGLLYMVLPGGDPEADIARLARHAPGRAYVAAVIHRRPGDAARIHRLDTLGRAQGVPMVATGRRAVPSAGAAHPAGCDGVYP